MAKLIMCQGLPGSGKTYWALEMMRQNPGTVIRVNKDDIRAILKVNHGWVWSQAAELQDVIPKRDDQIVAGLKAGMTVISDDTNLQRPHKERLAQLAFENGAEFEVKRFETPLEECILRDSRRSDHATCTVLCQYHLTP